jgi:hypothetical protein
VADACCIIDMERVLAAAMPPALMPDRFRNVLRSIVAALDADLIRD